MNRLQHVGQFVGPEEVQAEARRIASTHAVSRTNSPYSPYLVAASPTQTARTPQCPPLPPPPTATFRTVRGPFEPERTRSESLSVDCVSTSQRPTQHLGIFGLYFIFDLFECFRVLVSTIGLKCLHRADWVYHAHMLSVASRNPGFAAEAQQLRVARVKHFGYQCCWCELLQRSHATRSTCRCRSALSASSTRPKERSSCNGARMCKDSHF